MLKVIAGVIELLILLPSSYPVLKELDLSDIYRFVQDYKLSLHYSILQIGVQLLYQSRNFFLNNYPIHSHLNKVFHPDYIDYQRTRGFTRLILPDKVSSLLSTLTELFIPEPKIFVSDKEALSKIPSLDP